MKIKLKFRFAQTLLFCVKLDNFEHFWVSTRYLLTLLSICWLCSQTPGEKCNLLTYYWKTYILVPFIPTKVVRRAPKVVHEITDESDMEVGEDALLIVWAHELTSKAYDSEIMFIDLIITREIQFGLILWRG